MLRAQSGKALFPFIIAILIALCIYLYLPKSENNQKNQTKKATLVKVVTVLNKTQSIDIESLGTSRANQAIFINSAQDDYIKSVHFKDGDIVKAGQLLIQLNNAQEKAQVLELTVNLKEDKRQLNRLTKLAKTQSTAKSLLDEQQAKYESSLAQLEAAKVKLSEMSIKAPFDGMLGQRLVSQGAYITSSSEITTLDDISIIKVDFNIPEKYLSHLHTGMNVKAKSPAYHDKFFNGEVTHIGSRVNPTTRSVLITARFTNQNHQLRAGMLLHTYLQLSELTALQVPEKSIIPIQENHFVYIVEDNTAVKKQVEIGVRHSGLVEIKSGLNEGDVIITEGIIKIKQGSTVRTEGEAK